MRTLPSKAKNLQIAPFSDTLPAPIVFRNAYVPAEGMYPQHRHAWGEFVYSFSGVMEVKLADHHYLAHTDAPSPARPGHVVCRVAPTPAGGESHAADGDDARRVPQRRGWTHQSGYKIRP